MPCFPFSFSFLFGRLQCISIWEQWHCSRFQCFAFVDWFRLFSLMMAGHWIFSFIWKQSDTLSDDSTIIRHHRCRLGHFGVLAHINDGLDVIDLASKNVGMAVIFFFPSSLSYLPAPNDRRPWIGASTARLRLYLPLECITCEKQLPHRPKTLTLAEG